MTVRYIVYNSEENKFEDIDFEFSWININNSDKRREIECNYYLYKKKIKDFYKEQGLKYYNELYDSFYDEQFEQLTIN